ncbi:Phage portal protein [Anaerovibrio sp. JC8]|uniref:phage portal protein n=1 Tax=Anaerovibrio sp. JC8 TaxID=1240085 RepID=UPI000A09B3B1|nr:phage portal protein [Anaerovibrio sp. JC8]ORT99656.1 Phage portal protein [Anaerovibrio sp. JC8]
MLNRLKNLWTKEQRNEEAQALSDVLLGRASSEAMTKEKALNIPAVSASIEFIAGTVSGLPVKLYENQGGNVQEVTDDYRLKLLNQETGDTLDSRQMKKALITDMLLLGESYTYIKHDRNNITGLFYIEPSYVSILKGVDPIKKAVKIYINGQEYPDYEILRITRNTADGVTGQGIIDTNPLLLMACYNALNYENKSISTGTKRGFLKSAYKLDKAKMDALKSAWRKLYSNDANSSNVMVLNDGISFQEASVSSAENQLNENKKSNSELIYQLFGLSSSLFDGSKGSRDTYINSIKTGVLPVVSALENALNKFLLLEKEKGLLFFKVDSSEILKTTQQERYTAYNLALQGGWMTPDEVRKAENLPAMGLEFLKMSLGNTLYYPQTKQLYTPNTNTLQHIEGGEK